MASNPLFRHEALQAQRASGLSEIILVRPLSLTLLTTAASAMAVCVLLFFTFGTYTRRTTVSGVVMPDAGLVKVYAPQPGIVVERDIREGQHVTRGQTLYTVSTDLQSAAGGATQAALIAQARQRKASLLSEMDKTRTLQQDERATVRAKTATLRHELAQIEDQLAAQQLRTSIAADAAKRYRGLLAQDYISKDQAQQREADLLDQQSKLKGLLRERASTAQSLTEADNQLAGLDLKHQNQLAQIDRNVIDVDQNLIESEAKRRIVVTASQDGVVAAAVADVGQSVDTSRPLASIVPSGAQWQAHLFLPSTAIGFVRIGEPVLIRYQAFPYQKFGQYRAVVVSIARAALSATELANDGGPAATPGEGRDATFYRVIAALDDQKITASGTKQPLQAGMTLQSDILQERRRLYEWVLEPLYGLTGKL
ncbi:secretion protein [Pandoraea horticolens]|uniref:Secretion protein n=2 Tax=Pandoraea horticolens TaxID=2508298 RepID=A0A5E4WHK4_9BURK|nr:secretion protein [Pandoraea horticolens]